MCGEPEQIAAAFEKIEQNFGPIDVLVNNAAVFQWRDFWTQELEVMASIIDTNLKGTLFCTRLVLPYMLQRRRGRIVNVASVAGIARYSGPGSLLCLQAWDDRLCRCAGPGASAAWH